ncbi:flagellar biosynthesis protein FlhB [Marinospirillum alkaliphilum]|uniref:Flagellar biosynthetic protein FlhB n=1 Tax=Marinospirillum alkaliphilum DSM 21637 TaxID=1122209 RepID=A0A1K1VBB9_9GAMM|nr:flagellar biosynthesis protein FlhB [Marinospirillum alkaliphilum]SFX22433.1 flagellar biosynthetic protein FlhB [Marinospirillum alkaliphilum DSM 21637]
MAENQDGQEKTEEPTSKRKEDSRRDGEVARSKELSTTVLLLAAGMALLVFGAWMGNKALDIFAYNFDLTRHDVTTHDAMFKHFTVSVWHAIGVVLPFLIVLFVVGALSQIVVGGWNLTAKALIPKFSKLNPISGIKRIFSKNSLVEFVKSVAKVLLVGVTSFIIIWGLKEEFATLGAMALEPAIAKGSYLIIWSFLAISLSLIIVVLIDVPWQLHQHNEKLKMTRQEVKDEYKNTEGKPEVKSRIRRMQMEMAQRRMMADVPSADVVITNPTHYAVALKYDESGNGAPRVVAKGQDQIAAKIREIADHYQVPVLQLPPLSRAIYFSTEIGDEIPHALFMAVAQVLAYVFQLKQYKSGKARKPDAPKKVEVPPDLDPESS